MRALVEGGRADIVCLLKGYLAADITRQGDKRSRHTGFGLSTVLHEFLSDLCKVYPLQPLRIALYPLGAFRAVLGVGITVSVIGEDHSRASRLFCYQKSTSCSSLEHVLSDKGQ